MTNVKFRKTKMFYEANGKCEYCGCDMVLSYHIGHNTKETPINFATIDHKYNRDDENRNNITKEKRLFIVCWKCNNDKARVETNNHILNSAEKTAKRFIPKEKWTDEKFSERIIETIEREKELCRDNGAIDKEIKNLLSKKQKNNARISKTVNYRNHLLRIQQEEKISLNENT